MNKILNYCVLYYIQYHATIKMSSNMRSCCEKICGGEKNEKSGNQK